MDDRGKILVVDDEAVIRELLSDVLSDEGYAVECAANAREALALLREVDGFFLLFTDVMMPEMDGIELVREARKIRPDLIPIVMTGFASLESARGAVKEGAYDYILKPFSLSDIKLAVTNAVERYRLTRENVRLREITELFNISERIAAIHDEHALYDFVLKAAMERVAAERGSLMLVTPDRKGLRVVASVGVPDDASQSVVELGKGISGWVAEHVSPLLVENIRQTPDVARMSRQLEDPSFISVPLEHKHLAERGNGGGPGDVPNAIAVLNVTEKRDGAHFNEGDLKVLSIVANHAAAAIENVRLLRNVEEAHLSTLQSMALLLEAKDAYTHGHSERVRDYSVLAANRLGVSEQDIEKLRLGAALHDIGKVGVKDAVLNKAGRPTDEEWAMIRRHPEIGYDVLLPVRVLTQEHLHLVRSHHEELDGTGYPDGLKGDQLSALVRIIRVADAYDAMASNRAYRRALPPEHIIAELKRYSGSRFEPRVVKFFIDMIESGEIQRVAG